MNADEKACQGGFTLIEVLVALAIVALGLIAVFGQISQSAMAAGRLRDKTLAEWVAINVLTQLRLSGDFPKEGVRSDNMEMANTKWRYELKISKTEVDEQRRVDVTVSFPDRPDRPVAVATGFVLQRDKASPPSTSACWAPFSPPGPKT